MEKDDQLAIAAKEYVAFLYGDLPEEAKEYYQDEMFELEKAFMSGAVWCLKRHVGNGQ